MLGSRSCCLNEANVKTRLFCAPEPKVIAARVMHIFGIGNGYQGHLVHAAAVLQQGRAADLRQEGPAELPSSPESSASSTPKVSAA